jgi:hypothetical protein
MCPEFFDSSGNNKKKANKKAMRTLERHHRALKKPEIN